MKRSPPVDGFDYLMQRPVRMTAQEWREKYPPTIYTRRVENGETFYARPGQMIAAEAYANIPEGK